MDRQNILDLMKATAAQNGGQPLGRLRFETTIGIKEYHWTKYWPRYNELVLEAGFEPNLKTEAYSEPELLEFFATLTRRLGHFPTNNDLRGPNKGPTEKVFRTRFGSKVGMAQAVREFGRSNPGWDDVLALCPDAPVPVVEKKPATSTILDGYVYLMKSGRYYKIGKTNHVGRREREVMVQMPDPLTTVHSIITDDPDGIEAYWHRRFAAKRKNGEWFDLTAADIAAFRRRKFM
jgi:Meiotically up-regulated gene 113